MWSWCGSPCSNTSRPAARVSQLSATRSVGGKTVRKTAAKKQRRTTRTNSSSAIPLRRCTRYLFVRVERALDQPVLVGETRCLGPVLHAELAVDVREVELDRLRRDPELLRDLVVGEPARERLQDRELAV